MDQYGTAHGAYVLNLAAVGDVGILSTNPEVRQNLQIEGYDNFVTAQQIFEAMLDMVEKDVHQVLYDYGQGMNKDTSIENIDTQDIVQIRTNLVLAIAQHLKLGEEEVDPAMPLINLGVDSLSASELVYYFVNYGIKVTNTELISGVSINDIIGKYKSTDVSSGLNTILVDENVSKNKDVICQADIPHNLYLKANHNEAFPNEKPNYTSNYKRTEVSKKYKVQNFLSQNKLISLNNLLITGYLAWGIKQIWRKR